MRAAFDGSVFSFRGPQSSDTLKTEPFRHPHLLYLGPFYKSMLIQLVKKVYSICSSFYLSY